jgi:hypothetical protein
MNLPTGGLNDIASARGNLTAERLRALLSYDPDTGIFTWIKSRRGHRAGRVAGSRMLIGYRAIGIDGVKYYAHRLAVLHQTGRWHEAQVDHINGDRVDNRWCNLRGATNSQNAANTPPRSNNTLGLKGVSRNGKGWRARIVQSGREIHLGTFASPEEASAAYAGAAAELHGGFARVAPSEGIFKSGQRGEAA